MSDIRTGKRIHSACLADPGKRIYATGGQLVDNWWTLVDTGGQGVSKNLGLVGRQLVWKDLITYAET